MTDIKSFLITLKVPENRISFPQLVYAVHAAAKDEDLLNRITKDLYPMVAKHFGVSAGSVERNIRTLISAFWIYGDRALFDKMSHYKVKRKPRPREFISTVATYYVRNFSDAQ